jgi:hypothetical protein
VKKSTSYRQTFRQHRLLLTAPIVAAVLIAAVLMLGSPKSYESTASLWVDTPATTDSSLGNLNVAITPPSTQEQDVFTELLATPNFALTVGHHSLLGPYLAGHSSGGLLSGLLGGGGGSLDSQIRSALGPKQITSTVPGPQVLQISFSGPTPAVAQSTLNALVSELQGDSELFSQQHNQSALNYYKAQVQTATQAILQARNQADAYRNQHPNATTASDPNLAALSTAETAAGSQLTQANAGLGAAASAVKDGATVTQVHVIDAAGPAVATSGKKKALEGIVAGLLAGALISFLGTIALTRRESDPWEDEIAEAATSSRQAESPVAADASSSVGPAAVASSRNGRKGKDRLLVGSNRQFSPSGRRSAQKLPYDIQETRRS